MARGAALAAALLCGRQAAADEPPTFDVSIRDGRFEPTRLVVPAGTRIRLVLRNEGSGPSEFESAALHVEKVLAAGSRSMLVIQKLQPGTHRFRDEFHPDAGEFVLVAK